jgi:cytoskeletal protein RodZ
MESEDFGGLLRSARQRKGLTIADVSRATKIKESQLERLEAAQMDALPAEVFVVGFIKAFAREVGVDACEALKRYRAALPKPQIIETAPIDKIITTAPADPEAAPVHGKRLGVAFVVFLILIVATLTLSLLLRHTNPGGGLS